MILKWETPPVSIRAGGIRDKWGPVFVALKERPGKWARLETCDQPHRASARQNYLKHRAGKNFEFVTRKVDGKGTRVYGRYVG